MEFKPFPKIARLARRIIVTEKIDGSNGSIHIRSVDDSPMALFGLDTQIEVNGIPHYIRAGSRTQWIQAGKNDNFGFAAWVYQNAHELAKLGEGHHFGEWWGKGIQRGYGLEERRFSLFNTDRWANERPDCCNVVPVLYDGALDTDATRHTINNLAVNGSIAAPGFMKPEGIVVYHTAANLCFKQTCEHDSEPKNAHVKKERPPQQKRQPSNPDTTGRRKGCEGYTGKLLRSTDMIPLAVEETAGSFE